LSDCCWQSSIKGLRTEKKREEEADTSRDQRQTESGSEQFKLERVTLLNRFAYEYCNFVWQKANNKAYYGQLFTVVHSGLCTGFVVIILLCFIFIQFSDGFSHETREQSRAAHNR